MTNQLTRAHQGHRHAFQAWPPQIRIAAVVAASLVVEAIVAKNVLDVTVDIVAFLAPLWVFAVSLAWPVKDKAFEVVAMLLALGATAGMLIYYAV
jgi:hypothetical protein